jgi:hypothetical protein
MNDAVSHLTAEQYISQRLDQYQSWYDRKAVSTKARYLQMRSFSVVGSALVPVLINVHWDFKVASIPVIQFVVTLISLIVVVFLSLESVYHYREQWKNYRSTEQFLGHEKFLFRSSVGRYEGLTEENAFRTLVRGLKMLSLRKTPQP